MPLSQGQVLNNRYRVIKQIGQGGFGSVYRAWDLNLSKPCAIKENLDPSPGAQRQFEREAVVLAGLHHPNLVTVTDYFTIAGQSQYLVMDFIDGEDLDCLLEREGPLDPKQAVAWIAKICDGLEYMHTRVPPIFHRDLKPANIRLNKSGEPVLVDFGLVKVYAPGQKTTQGARAVTPGYAPLEQYGNGITDARSDIYALAATLYALLTGAPPLEAPQRYTQPVLAPIRAANPRVPAHFDPVLAKALSLNPGERYQKVGEFRQALQDALVLPKPAYVSPPPKVVTSTPAVHAGPVVSSIPYRAVSVRSAPQKSIWKFGLREFVFSFLGIMLFGVLSAILDGMQIPGAGSIGFRPTMAIVLFFGLAFGPVVGFLTGILGLLTGGLLSGYGFWPWWALGTGMMGLMSGRYMPAMTDYRGIKDLFQGEKSVFLGSFIGMALASFSEIWVSNVSIESTFTMNFIPAVLTSIVNGLIFLPILMVIFGNAVVRSRKYS